VKTIVRTKNWIGHVMRGEGLLREVKGEENAT